jgi:hypothetical protein
MIPWLLVLALQNAVPDDRAIPLDSVDLSLRLVFPGGSVTGIGGGPKYRRLFDTGTGLGVAGDYFFKVSPQFKIGPYVEIAYDSFGGGSVKDLFANTIDVDSMATFRVLGGAKAREPLGQDSAFYLEQDTYVGAVIYPDVGGTTSAGPNDLELFKGATGFCMGLELGAGWRAGSRVDLFFGTGIEIAGGPDKGENLGILTLNSSKDPENLLNTMIRFGATIRF